MPYSVVKRNGPRPWKIMNEDTGRIVGSSDTAADAKASIRARYAVKHSGFANKLGSDRRSKRYA